MTMHRTGSEVFDLKIKESILDLCDIMHIAMHDDESPYPYMVAVNFGYKFTEDKLKLYFHSALEGKKLNLMRRNPNVCCFCTAWRDYWPIYFECEEYGYRTNHNYRSVEAFGQVHELLNDTPEHHREYAEGMRAFMTGTGRSGTGAPAQLKVRKDLLPQMTLFVVECDLKDVYGKAKFTLHSPQEVPFEYERATWRMEKWKQKWGTPYWDERKK